MKNVLYTGLSRHGGGHLGSIDIDSGCLTGGHSFDFHLVQICVMNTISSVFGCHCFIIYQHLLATPRTCISGISCVQYMNIEIVHVLYTALISMQVNKKVILLISFYLNFQLPVLVYEAICIQVWRLKIYPQIMKLEPAPANTFGIYMVVSTELNK